MGVVSDYDLMANAEDAARGVRCAICDAEPVTFRWADYREGA